MTGTRAPHPLAHDALICVDAPGMAVCPQDGQLRGRGVTGLFHDGRRLLARSLLTVGGTEPEPISSQVVGAGTARFLAMHRFVADPTPDPALVVDRTRQADGRERVVVRNTAARPVRVPVELSLGTDLAGLGELRLGRRGPDLPARVCPGGLSWTAPDGWGVRATANPAPETALAATGLLRWDITLEPAASWAVELRVTGEPAGARVGHAAGHGIPAPRAPLGPPPWSEARVRCDDVRVTAWVRQSLMDLRGLLIADPEHRTVPMPAAGAPWQLTPTGRDSVWTARMLLPLGTRLAAGTLRMLADRQGVRHDPVTGEEPGKIPHSLGPGGRAPRWDCAGSTALYVTLMGEARLWGLTDSEVEPLLPHARRALDHLAGLLEAHEDGIVRLGPGGPAPCELQGQVYQAASHGAALLREEDAEAAELWAERAAKLAARFRQRFRTEDGAGAYYAAALDREGRPVPVPNSAMGQLPGTGILDEDGCADVARRLLSPDLNCGWGLRGVGSRTPGYHPLAVRGGVVRAHETCVAVAGLAVSGQADAAYELLSGLLEAAPHFGYRMPEMHAGEQRVPGHGPVAHPLACRPLARSAAAVLPALVALAGVRPDAREGRVTVRPPAAPAFGELELADLRIAGHPFTVRVNRQGQAVVEEAPDGLQLAV
ncbi:amylo-alpha-1,6-glucosidase [Yinghuangia seranimata]|uniref:amylo-alpha-1,6-glucosidase n=1 Tax=Yinghuangia seranimata TaxID=408067 RepID=UPI00248BA248|nr:glycogen debranching N-terminal domain-containing protein [Yinghuangia seranimata]MDI2128670.1 glycogen debranching N-terminal domain-containing protein [Yinghuangia seranimata]